MKKQLDFLRAFNEIWATKKMTEILAKREKSVERRRYCDGMKALFIDQALIKI